MAVKAQFGVYEDIGIDFTGIYWTDRLLFVYFRNGTRMTDGYLNRPDHIKRMKATYPETERALMALLLSGKGK